MTVPATCGGAWRELRDELREFKNAANDLLRRQRDGLRKIE